ncbi:hypothetical protein ACV566_00310 [Staphylococcus aureus]
MQLLLHPLIALTPKNAILMAAVMNFIGALTFTGCCRHHQPNTLVHLIGKWISCRVSCKTCGYYLEFKVIGFYAF